MTDTGGDVTAAAGRDTADGGDLDGAVVVITGATAGVGRAASRAFARRGARIGLLARGRDRLESTRLEVESLGSRAVAAPTDVADAEAVEAAAERIEEELGEIDVWVNNAMTTIFAPFTEVTPEEYRRATEVTYLGQVYGTMSALRRMKERNRGTIVQVGSALAYRAIPLQAPYCGAKHACRGFTDSIRSELLYDGSDVHVTMVHLPGLNTPQFDWCRSRFERAPRPVPPVYQPEVAAEAIVFAATHRRREVMVGIPTIRTVYGQKVAPWYLDRYLAENVRDGQLDEATVDEDRPDNLFEPVEGAYAAHGRFDDEARSTSPQLTATEHRRPLLLAGAGLLAAGLLAAGLSRWLGGGGEGTRGGELGP